MKKLPLMILLCLCLLCTPGLAADFADEQAAGFGVGEVEDAVPDGARDIIADAGVADVLDTDGFLSRVWDRAAAKISEAASGAVKSAAAVVAIAMLCGVFWSLSYEEAPRYVTLGGTLAISAVAIGGGASLIKTATETLCTLSDFSRALLPCLCASAAAGGATTSAAAKYAATTLFIDVFLAASVGVIVPLIYTYVAASVAASALDNPALDSAASLMKWLCTMSMTLLMTAFTLYLTLTGAISGSADVLVLKAAKTAISTLLPVVGGIISDAAGTVVAGAGLINGAVGVFGMVVVLGTCLVPFVRIGVQYLLYKAAAMLAGSFAGGRIGSLVSSIGSAFGMLLGLVGAGAIMLFLSIVSMIKAVGG